MKKKDRSPEKPQVSPNPRPKRCNKKQRESMVKSKKKDSPVGTPIQTPLNTPDQPQADNSFLPLQSESEEEEEQSVATITADDPPADINDLVDQAPVASPEECKNASGFGPIAEILPTDLE
jgi:hypothetical protein